MRPVDVIGWLVVLVLTAGCVYVATAWFRDSGDGTASPFSTISMAPTSSTSSTLVLQDVEYRRGDCVTWDQEVRKDLERRTRVVPCAEPHLFEFIKTVRISGDHKTYPSEQEWNAIADAQCGPLVPEYLGYPLDPNGRFGVGTIHPTAEGWTLFDRDLQCGIQLRGTLPGNDQSSIPFAGAVKGQDQASLWNPGTCLRFSDTATDDVPCDQPHHAVVVGAADVPAGAKPVDDAYEVDRLAAHCKKVAQEHLRRALPAGLTGSHLNMAQSSWDVGQRRVECIIESTTDRKEIPAL